jgi:hypothetical protein
VGAMALQTCVELPHDSIDSSRITRKDFTDGDQVRPSRVFLNLNRSRWRDYFQLLNFCGPKRICCVIVDERNEYVDPIFHQTSFVFRRLLIDGEATTVSFRTMRC